MAILAMLEHGQDALGASASSIVVPIKVIGASPGYGGYAGGTRTARTCAMAIQAMLEYGHDARGTFVCIIASR